MPHKHAHNRGKASVSLRPFDFLRGIGLTLFGLLATGAWAHGQDLPVSDPYEILATDPGTFIQLLDDARPSPVAPEAKEMVLKSLPPEGEITVLNASARWKLAALDPVLHATRRDGVYEVKIIDVSQAAVAIHGRAVILISEPALGVLDADQLRAVVAHEVAHEYVWEEWHRAARRHDWTRLRQLELICDGIAAVILHQLGSDSSALITGFEKMMLLNLLSAGTSLKTWGHPTLDQRRKFERAVAAWIATAGRGPEPRLAPLPLTVAIHDSADLPPPMLERAKGVATGIYGRIGVSLRWLAGPQIAGAVQANPAACPDSPTPLIHLRLLGRSANPDRPTGDLGFAMSGGTLASVLVEPVVYVAKTKSVDLGDLLGVVMAHEIGHVLLPPDSHSTGLMAPKIDLFLIDHGGPSFTQPQASVIRARIASLSRSGQGPC